MSGVSIPRSPLTPPLPVTSPTDGTPGTVAASGGSRGPTQKEKDVITIPRRRTRAGRAIRAALTERLGAAKANRLLADYRAEVAADLATGIPTFDLTDITIAENCTVTSVLIFDTGYRITVRFADGRTGDFVTDTHGVVQRAPRGYGTKYRPGRIDGIGVFVRPRPQAVAA